MNTKYCKKYAIRKKKEKLKHVKDVNKCKL